MKSGFVVPNLKTLKIVIALLIEAFAFQILKVERRYFKNIPISVSPDLGAKRVKRTCNLQLATTKGSLHGCTIDNYTVKQSNNIFFIQ